MDIQEVIEQLLQEEVAQIEGQDLINAHVEAISLLEELKQYRTVGTLEECKTAREKMKPKKPYIETGERWSQEINCYECPACDSFLGHVSDCKDECRRYDYCKNCGQLIDWS